MVELQNNVTLDVRFRCQVLVRNGNGFIDAPDKKRLPKEHVTRTYCYLSTVDRSKPKGKDRYTHLSSTFVTQHVNDTYDKRNGFKMALAKALMNSNKNFNKEDRRRIWQWFFENVDFKSVIKNQDLLMTPAD